MSALWDRRISMPTRNWMAGSREQSQENRLQQRPKARARPCENASAKILGETQLEFLKLYRERFLGGVHGGHAYLNFWPEFHYDLLGFRPLWAIVTVKGRHLVTPSFQLEPGGRRFEKIFRLNFRFRSSIVAV